MVLAAVAVAALGAWLAEGGPVPGLAAATLSAPLLAGALGGITAAIRLQEARTNRTGVAQLQQIEAAQGELWLAIGAAGIGVVLVGLLVGFGVSRARRAGVPVSHPYAVLPWAGFLLLLLRLAWATVVVVSGWKGLTPMHRPEIVVHGLALAVGGGFGLVACAVSASISLGIGGLWRLRRRGRA